MADPSRHRVTGTGNGRSALVATIPGSRGALHDPRWPAIVEALDVLREGNRRAVRIVDADCGNGTLLLLALRHARAVGFTAIEGRGIGRSPALIDRASAAARRAPDLAIGVTFEVADTMTGLAEEYDLPADILLWHGARCGDRTSTIHEVHRAGNVVIGDADRFRAHAA